MKSLLGTHAGNQLSLVLDLRAQVLDLAATSCMHPCVHAGGTHLNPGRHSGKEINEQAGIFSIIACHKVAIHHEAFSQIASDDESSVKQQCNIQCEQETCKRNMVRLTATATAYSRLCWCLSIQTACVGGKCGCLC